MNLFHLTTTRRIAHTNLVQCHFYKYICSVSPTLSHQLRFHCYTFDHLTILWRQYWESQNEQPLLLLQGHKQTNNGNKLTFLYNVSQVMEKC